MKSNFYYVIYRLTFRNAQSYIGKAKNYNRRVRQHQLGVYDSANLKEMTVINNMGFTSRVLMVAPSYLDDSIKQIWMDNMERIVIHCEAKKTYDEITGENSDFKDYQPYREIINRKMVNTQLY
jgi:hypothetical protein